VPIIFYGTKGITYSAGAGQFHCPACGPRQDYRSRRVRRFFTLYFIPIIPLDLVGEYVECQKCQGTFKPEILSWDPEKERKQFEAEFHRATRQVMVLMMLADGNVEQEEVEMVSKLYHQITDRELSPEDVAREVDHLRKTGGKAMVAKAAYLVAAADGHFAEQEKALLGEVAAAMEMSPEAFAAAIAELQQA
jgi:tellurite resistance protein